jgi:hypothetical protein
MLCVLATDLARPRRHRAALQSRQEHGLTLAEPHPGHPSTIASPAPAKAVPTPDMALVTGVPPHIHPCVIDCPRGPCFESYVRTRHERCWAPIRVVASSASYASPRRAQWSPPPGLANEAALGRRPRTGHDPAALQRTTGSEAWTFPDRGRPKHGGPVPQVGTRRYARPTGPGPQFSVIALLTCVAGF